jgi:NAD(P)H-hydrate repair Nnr-like enzyme with NAD(P)H-hydrate epimerase domain
MARLQLTGFVTIAKSAELSDEDKAKVLKCKGEGKVKAVRAKLVDVEGNEIVVQAVLGLSSKGSLTGRFAAKLDKFELVEVDKDKNKAEAKASSVDALAAELLGS